MTFESVRVSPHCVQTWFADAMKQEQCSPHDTRFLDGVVWVITDGTKPWPFSGGTTRFASCLAEFDLAHEQPDLIVFHVDLLHSHAFAQPGALTGLGQQYHAAVFVLIESAWGEIRPCRTTFPLSLDALKIAAYAACPTASNGLSRIRGLELETVPFPLPVNLLEPRLAKNEPGNWGYEELSPHELWVRTLFTHDPAAPVPLGVTLSFNPSYCVWFPKEGLAAYLRSPTVEPELVRYYELIQAHVRRLTPETS